MKISKEPDRRPLEFHIALDRYGQLNSAWNPENPKKPARQELQALFLDLETGLPLPELVIRKNIERMITSLVARTIQVEDQGENLTPASEEEQRKAVRTFLKTAQEILSHPLDRQNFSPGEGSVEEIVIDPLLVTNTLLDNLGLGDLKPPKRTRDEQKPAYFAQAIPEVKAMLKNLEPVALNGKPAEDTKYFRLMRMSAGQNEGYILGTQNIEGQKILFKTDLYGAERRLLHIEDQYRDEIKTLEEIRVVLENVRNCLDSWSRLSPEDLSEITEKLTACIENLQFVRNGDKRRLKLQVTKSLELRDSRGRHNPSATQARLTAALTNLSSRLDDISGIWRYVGLDKAKISQVIGEQKAPMREFAAIVERLHSRFRILHPEEALEEGEKTKITGNLEKLRESAASQKYEPYLSVGRKVVAQIDLVLEALDKNDLPHAAREFTKIYFIAKLQRAYDGVQDVYKDISLNPDIANPADIFDRTDQIHTQLKEHEVAPQMDIDDYYGAYGKMYHLLNGIKKELRPAIPDPQMEMPFAPEHPSLLSDILSRLERLPGVRRVIGQVRNLFGQVLRQTAPKQPEPKPVLEKKQAFLKAKERFQNFDFVNLIKEDL